MSCVYASSALKDFNKICRTCLESTRVTPIIGTIVGDMKVEDLLEYSVMIEVNENDSLPQNICDNCLVKLYETYQFKKSCHNNENTLKLLVQNVSDEQVEIKEEFPNSLVEENEYKIDVTEESNCDQVKSEPKAVPDSYKCKDCDYISPFKEERLEHRKKAQHGEFKKNKCQICDKTFRRNKMGQHMRTHTKERPYQCDMCPRSFAMKDNLKRHKRSHTGERPFVCSSCGKRFTRAATLYDHEKSHQAPRSSHLSNINFKCNICGRNFKRSAPFNTHLEKHANPDKFVKKIDQSENEQEACDYLCDTCGRAFKTKLLLSQHKLSHGEKSFLCSVCGRGFSTKAILFAHLKVHSGEKPHTCLVCKKSFKHVNNLDAHMLIHQGLKPHKCTYCSKSFTQSSHLTHHLRTHSGEKPYTCTYCYKRFAVKSTLTVHMRIHTGETPYVCPVCGKGFYDSSSMKKHHQKHIKAEPEGQIRSEPVKNEIFVKSEEFLSCKAADKT